MTNREYIESLSDKEFAEVVWRYQPWLNYCFDKASRYDTDSYDENCDERWVEANLEALEEWLNLEYKEKE